jgi:hypothetical protein
VAEERKGLTVTTIQAKPNDLCKARVRTRKHPNGWGFECAFHGPYSGRYATEGRAIRAVRRHRETCAQQRRT